MVLYYSVKIINDIIAKLNYCPVKVIVFGEYKIYLYIHIYLLI